MLFDRCRILSLHSPAVLKIPDLIALEWITSCLPQPLLPEASP